MVGISFHMTPPAPHLYIDVCRCTSSLRSSLQILDTGVQVQMYWSECFFPLKPFLLQFHEILFVDEATGQKAFFTYKLSSTLVAAANYGKQFPSTWLGNGVTDTKYEYQLLICDTYFYSGYFISGYTRCYKVCTRWCGDILSPYFRSASTNSGFAGVAFNINGHFPRKPRLISVGLRWIAL